MILTSNLGSQFLSDQSLTQEMKTDAVMETVRHAFKPEFLNRLDETVMFDPLSADDLAGIVDLMVGQLAKRLEGRRITLDVSEPARGLLTRIGYDPAYGARPLRRLIQKEIGDKLAKMLLAGEVGDGSTVRVDVSEDLETLSMQVVAEGEEPDIFSC